MPPLSSHAPTGKLAVLRALLGYFGTDLRWLYLGLFLGLGDGACQALVPMFFRHVLNGIEADPAAFLQTGLVRTAWWGLGLMAVFFPVAYFFHVLTSVAAARFARNLQLALHEHVQRLSADFFHRRKVGEITARLTSDLEVVSGGAGTLSYLVWTLVMMAQSTVMMLLIDVRLTLTFVALMIVVAVWTHFYMPQVHRMNRRVRDAAGGVSALVTEYVALNPLIKSFSREDYAQSRISRQADVVRLRREHMWWRQFLFTDLMQVLVRFVAPFALLFYGTYLIAGGRLRIGDLTAFWGYWLLMGGSLTALLGIVTQVVSIFASIDRIFEFLHETPLIKDRPQARLPGPVRGEVEFREVSFQYPNERGGPVLDRLQLHIPPGQRVALVGPSGAGKSTILQLLLRFYDPVEGAVRLDGVDLRDLQQHALRQKIGVVLQESVFFAGTVLENMRLAKPGATREEIEEALQAANALEFIERMEGGLYTFLGERGLRLSGGQKQRLSIARVFLKNPPVLLFDEATSALDSVSERVVKEAMDRLMRNRTSILVAHRIGTVMDADRICVMERGRIVASGRHPELLRENPLYAELCATQGLRGPAVG